MIPKYRVTSNQCTVTSILKDNFEFDFEKLNVYQKSLDLIDKIFEIYKTALSKVNMPVSYLTEDEIKQLVEGCKKERDRLLILLLFQTGLRISEALALTPADIGSFEGRPVLEVLGKGKKLRMVAVPQNLKDKLESYAYCAKIEPEERFFDINRGVTRLGRC